MPRHKKGTLVRAYTKEELGEDQWEKNCAEEFIAPNGYLWVVQRWIPVYHYDNEHDANAYECKSLATGVVEQLFPNEITTKKPKEQDNGNIPSQEASDQAATQV